MHPRTLKAKVERVLKDYPETRDSDIKLRQQIIRNYYRNRITYVGNEEALLFRDEFDVPTQEPVKRWRAKFQNEFNEYLPTDWKVAKQRGIERKKWEEALGYSRDPAVVREQKQMISETQPPKFDGEQGALFNVPPKRRLII